MSKQKSFSSREAFASQYIKEYARLRKLQQKAGENDINITLGNKKIIVARATMPDTSVTTEYKVNYTTNAHGILVDLIDQIIGEYYDAYRSQFKQLCSEMARDEQFKPLDGVLELVRGERRVALNAINAHGKTLLRKYFPKAKNGEPTSGLNKEGNAVFYDYLPHGYNNCVSDLFELLALAECKEMRISNANTSNKGEGFQPEGDGKASKTPQSDNQSEEDKKTLKIQEPIELPEELKELVGKYHLSVDDQYIAAMTKIWDDLTEKERVSALGKILDELERRADEINANMIGILYIEAYINQPDPHADIDEYDD